MAGFLQDAEGLIPLLMLGGMFAGGGRRGRRSGSSGGGFLSTLLAQQAQRQKYEMERQAEQETARNRFLGSIIEKSLDNGSTLPEGGSSTLFRTES